MKRSSVSFHWLYWKISWWKQMPLRRDWEPFFPRNRKTDGFTQWPMAAGCSPHTKRITILRNWSFLALKWAVTEHFKEYLLYQPFLVKTDNNPLTHIMTTPNLDATGHRWVSALAKYDFWLQYQKGWDNAVTDALSQVTAPSRTGSSAGHLGWSNHGYFPKSREGEPSHLLKVINSWKRKCRSLLGES